MQRSKLTFDHFRQMEQLELQFYGFEHITPAEEAYAWYERYPNTTVAALDDGKVVGFVNLFPVKEGIYRSIRAGKFDDGALTLEGLVDPFGSSEEPLHMLLSCIVVSREHRAQGLARQLLQQAVRQYQDVAHRCKSVVTDNVTAEGERFSERYGFATVCCSDHESRVFEQPYEDFCAKVMRASGGQG